MASRSPKATGCQFPDLESITPIECSEFSPRNTHLDPAERKRREARAKEAACFIEILEIFHHKFTISCTYLTSTMTFGNPLLSSGSHLKLKRPKSKGSQGRDWHVTVRRPTSNLANGNLGICYLPFYCSRLDARSCSKMRELLDDTQRGAFPVVQTVWRPKKLPSPDQTEHGDPEAQC